MRQVFTGQVASKIFGQILEATFYRRQVKLPQVSAGWITTNKVLEEKDQLEDHARYALEEHQKIQKR